MCGPLGADFDGDTVALQLVPEEAKEDIYNKMSAKYMHTYRKSNKPIFDINHETLKSSGGYKNLLIAGKK